MTADNSAQPEDPIEICDAQTSALVLSAQAGDAKALAQLCERYVPRVRQSVALKLGCTRRQMQENEELVQEAFVFRLPTDLEFERAARGVDRRAFAWGSYLVWSFCSSDSGNVVREVDPVASHAMDESVFGIRDLTGSVSEPTPGLTREGYRYVSFRGGSWYDTEEVYFHLATRTGRFPESAYPENGVRLVLELIEGSEGDRGSASR
jgi:hypothetical protein